jgi:hypothetical protein
LRLSCGRSTHPQPFYLNKIRNFRTLDLGSEPNIRVYDSTALNAKGKPRNSVMEIRGCYLSSQGEGAVEFDDDLIFVFGT